MGPHWDEDGEDVEDEVEPVHHLGQGISPGDDLEVGGAHGVGSLLVWGGQDDMRGHLAYQGIVREAEEGRQGPDHWSGHKERSVYPHHKIREAAGKDGLEHGEHKEPGVEGDHQEWALLAVEQQEGQAVVAEVELLKAGENVIVRDVEQQQVFQPREDLAELSDPVLPKVQGPQLVEDIIVAGDVQVAIVQGQVLGGALEKAQGSVHQSVVIQGEWAWAQAVPVSAVFSHQRLDDDEWWVRAVTKLGILIITLV